MALRIPPTSLIARPPPFYKGGLGRCRAGDSVVKCKNPQRTRLRMIAKRRGKMKKKCFSTFILSGNYEEKKGGNMKKVLSYTYSSISSIFIDL
jgi:hypothetical protein